MYLTAKIKKQSTSDIRLFITNKLLISETGTIFSMKIKCQVLNIIQKCLNKFLI